VEHVSKQRTKGTDMARGNDHKVVNEQGEQQGGYAVWLGYDGKPSAVTTPQGDVRPVDSDGRVAK